MWLFNGDVVFLSIFIFLFLYLLVFIIYLSYIILYENCKKDFKNKT